MVRYGKCRRVLHPVATCIRFWTEIRGRAVRIKLASGQSIRAVSELRVTGGVDRWTEEYRFDGEMLWLILTSDTSSDDDGWLQTYEEHVADILDIPTGESPVNWQYVETAQRHRSRGRTGKCLD